MMTCKDKECEGQTPASINLDDVSLITGKGHKDVVELTEKIKVKLKYPDIDRMTRPPDESQMDSIFEITKACVDTIQDGTEMHDIKDYTEKELEDFIMSLNQQQFGKIIAFFNTMPKLRHELKFSCQKCNKKQEVVLEGLQSFFG